MMNVSENQTYRFADVEIDVLRGCVVRENEEKHLRRKSFQVLVHLIEHRERLVMKDELMQTVWKDTAVTDDVLVQCIKEIRRAVGDDSHNSHFIKTVPKSGYRFIGEIQSQSAVQSPMSNVQSLSEVQNLKPKIQNPKSKIHSPASAVTSHLILISIVSFTVISLVLGFVGQNMWQANRQNNEVRLPQISGKKTVAVMFFENRADSAELDWLREGLADMLIANLSRSDKLTVLSRAQLHLLLERVKQPTDNKIKLEDALEIARKTSGETIITGSFAKLGEKIRVDVTLYDVKTGFLQTTESLTVEKAEQILTEIDLLSLKMLAHLKVTPAEKNNLATAITNNLEAYRYYSLAIEKAQALHNREAIELLEKAVALDPDFALAYARIGYVYAVTWDLKDKGKPYLEKAFQLSERLTEKDKLSIAAWYSIANFDFTNAIQIYREIIAKHPLETEAYLRLGKLLSGEGRTEEALSVLKQGLTVDSEAKDIYNSLGGILSSLGRNEEAISAHQRYVALAPDEANAYDSLGLTYQQAGNYAEAAENYNHALELKPNFEVAVIHLANVRFQTGRYREAIELYKKYIAVAPSDNEKSRGFACLSIIYRRQNNRQEAENAARTALKFNRENVMELLRLKIENGEKETVETLEKPFFAQSSSNRGSRGNRRFEFYMRGFLALKRGQTEESLQHFRELLSHPAPTWNIEDFEDSLANAYLETGKVDEAIAEYERILQKNPNYPLARFRLAQAFEKKGLPDKARESYQQFLSIWKDADADIPEIITAKHSGK